MSIDGKTSVPLPKRHRITLDVEPGFEFKVKLLAAKWGVKTNVAVQRAVDLAGSKNLPADEILAVKHLATRMEDVLRHILPP